MRFAAPTLNRLLLQMFKNFPRFFFCSFFRFLHTHEFFRFYDIQDPKAVVSPLQLRSVEHFETLLSNFRYGLATNIEYDIYFHEQNGISPLSMVKIIVILITNPYRSLRVANPSRVISTTKDVPHIRQ